MNSQMPNSQIEVMKKSALEILDSKISMILENYDKLKKENSLLRDEVSKSRAVEAALHHKISLLQEDEELRDLELEEIVLRIEKSIELTEEIA